MGITAEAWTQPSPTPNSTDVIVPQRAVSKCPLTQNLPTP